jgi:Fe-S cluster assembly iron-binding protein IscA
MLTLTERAATVLNEARSQQGVPGDALVRVAPAAGAPEGGISVGFVDQAQLGDHTASVHGVDLCVAPEVADALDAAQIDVDQSSGAAQLVIVPAG